MYTNRIHMYTNQIHCALICKAESTGLQYDWEIEQTQQTNIYQSCTHGIGIHRLWLDIVYGVLHQVSSITENKSGIINLLQQPRGTLPKPYPPSCNLAVLNNFTPICRLHDVTYFLPSSSGTSPAITAASPVAPAPSTTAFSHSTKRRIAKAMCSSLQGQNIII